jgi:hypothetical protein
MPDYSTPAGNRPVFMAKITNNFPAKQFLITFVYILAKASA